MILDEGFLKRSIVGEDVLLPIGSKVIDFKGLLTLSPIGAYIYDLIEEGKTEKEIVASILQEYDTDRESAENDLAEFLTELREHGVLHDE